MFPPTLWVPYTTGILVSALAVVLIPDQLYVCVSLSPPRDGRDGRSGLNRRIDAPVNINPSPNIITYGA